MNYYEELGVSAEASEEEIRKAFRNLSRMIHPDQHQDERLKQLAEVQMKRLTGIVDTLCHTDKRQVYDLSLLEPTSISHVETEEKLPPPRPNRWVPLLAGILFGGLLVYSLAIFFQARQAAIPEEAHPVQAETSKPAPSKPVAQRENPRKTAVQWRESSESIPESTPSQPPAPPEQESSVALKVEVVPPPVPRVPVAVPSAPILGGPAASAPVAKMSGTWLYVPKVRPAARNGKPVEKWEYTAEFVEMRVREEAGLVEGSYRSRYRIPDKPLQPEVSFRFQGSLDGKELDWEGPGGAKGKIQFEFQGENTLLARWRAIETGNVLSLASGSALLVRRID